MENFDAYARGEDDTRPFDSDGYMGFDPRLPSQRFDSFRMSEEGYGDEHYTQEEHKELEEEEEYGAHKEGNSSNGGLHEAPPPYRGPFDDDLGEGQSPSMASTFGQSFESRLPPEFPADEFSHSIDSNGKGFGHSEGFPHSEGFGHSEVDSIYGFPLSGSVGGFHNGGSVLPPPDEMQPEVGFVLREWKRKNAIHLEEKARNEREKLSRIIDAADGFKDEFYEKRRMHCQTSKTNNRDKEKVFLENLENFHATADKHYWKAVAELIPNEIPSVELKSRANKDKKKPSVVINHGPKPGKATDLTRMRQILVKLKHNPPAHMKAPPPPPPAAPGAEGANAKSSEGADAPAPAPLEKLGSIPVVAAA